MSLEDFHLIDCTSVDTSKNERDFMKLYHQQGAQLNDSNQGIGFLFGDNNNYHQIGNGYLEFDITLRRNGGNFKRVDGDSNVDEPIRLVNIALAYAFNKATLSTTGGKGIEQNEFDGHVQTIQRYLTRKGGDLLYYFI